MAKKASKAGTKGFPPRAAFKPNQVRFIVELAGLVGTNWETRAVSGSVYLQGAELLKDLAYWLNRRKAFVIGPAKENGHGWTDLVCWPGRGMFVVKLAVEERKP